MVLIPILMSMDLCLDLGPLRVTELKSYDGGDGHPGIGRMSAQKIDQNESVSSIFQARVDFSPFLDFLLFDYSEFNFEGT